MPARKLADRLQHPVARTVVEPLHHDERLLDQRGDEIEHVVSCERSRAADRLGGGEIETANENAQPVEQDLLAFVQEIVRPRDERMQRLLPLQRHATAAGQKLEAIVETHVDLGDR